MKVSYNWIKQFISIDLEVEKVAEILTGTGLEVEGIEPFESIKGGLKGVVTGHVLSCKKHPNADKLNITTVDLGNGEPVQIVCGAPNVAVGQKVPVATIGTLLYDSKGEEFKIKKGKIRGEESFGMICAEDELGLGKNHEGIMVLDENIQPGTPISKVFSIETDYTIEIGLTPNRADAMGHFGVARDLRATLLQQFQTDLKIQNPEKESLKVDNKNNTVQVTVEDYKLCPRYTGVTLEGLEVKDSPEWLQNRLKTIGLTPINNIVDATNYILHDLGQPLHAFDLENVKGNQIIVKKGLKGTKFTTLDEVERTLHEEDLMICNQEIPMCIAGTFGGLHSGVSHTTTKIFLESAYFNPVSVRKTAKRHTINTDSSFRFERGIDPNMTLIALKKAANLIKEIAGGHVSSEIIDLYPDPIQDFEIHLNFKTIDKLLGEKIPHQTTLSILNSLDIKVLSESKEGLILNVPPYRVDVQREADIIEEIVRIYGYNKIKIPTKLNTSIVSSERFNPNQIQEKTANHLASIGFNEMLSNSLEKALYNDLSQTIDNHHTVTILNPLSQDLNTLRQSLLWGGLEAVSHNINHKNTDLKLFEFGKTYHQLESEYREFQCLALFITGKRLPENWIHPASPSDFYYAKGIVENILTKLKLNALNYFPVNNDVFAEGILIQTFKKPIAEVGIIKQTLSKHFDINQPVIYAHLHWNTLLEFVTKQQTHFTEIPKYPSSRKDLALLIDQNVRFNDLYHTAFQTERHLLKKVNLFDVYEGKNLPQGKKSYALSFELQDHNKTLNDKQIDKTMSKLITAFEKQFGAELRS
ncbi:MAG: phenylalanine--tRNA ligase subunit beta [Flavobacteriales bacterium]